MDVPTLENLQKGNRIRNYATLVLIEDDNNKWVDFSDRVSQTADRILKIPSIRNNVEARFLGAKYTSSAGTLEVDNSDDFWDGPLSITMRTLDGSTASFASTYKTSETVWTGRRIQFRLVEFSQNVPVEEYLGTFVIDDVVTSLKGKATLSLVGLERPLQEQDASIVKDGRTRYQHRRIPFLVRQLLAVEYGDRNSGDIPTTFNIADDLDLSTADGSLTTSTMGKIPQKVDTDYDGTEDIFMDSIKRTRVMCMASATLAERASFLSADTIYVACDDEIYIYEPDTDLYTKCLASGEFGTGYKIRYMWYVPISLGDDDNPAGQYIYGIAYPDLETDRTEATNFRDWAGVTAKIFKFTHDGTAVGSVELVHTVDYFYDGKQHYLAGVQWTGADETGRGYTERTIGRFAETINYRYNLFVNHQQVIRAHSVGGVRPGIFRQVPDFSSSEFAGAGEYTGGGEDYFDQAIGEDTNYFNIYTAEKNGANNIDELGVRISWGQQGCVAFSSQTGWNSTYKHGIIYYGVVNGTGYGDIDLWAYDIYLDSILRINDSNTTTKGTDTITLYPIASCIDEEGDYYVGYYGINETNASASIPGVNAAVIYRYDYLADTFTQVDNYSDKFQMVPLEFIWNSSIAAYGGDTKTRLMSVCMNPQVFNPWGVTTDTNDALYSIRTLRAISSGALMSNSAAILKVYTNQPKGFTLDSSNDVYFVIQGSGYIAKYDVSENSFSAMDDGGAIVEDNTFLESDLLVDTVTRVGSTIIWGSAANVFDPQMTIESSPGSYLFKLDDRISDHVHVADFDGLSIYEALGLLAQRANCVQGFDEKGDYFFRKRAIGSTTDYTVNADDGEVDNIIKKRGRDQIFNYVEIVPFMAEFEMPSYKAFLQKRGATEAQYAPAESDILLRQLDSKTKNVTLICVGSGDAVIDGDTGSRSSGYPLFKYAVYEQTITGRYARDHNGEGTIYAASVFGGSDSDFGIKRGYYLLYVDSNENSYYYLISSVNADNNTFTLAGSNTVTTQTNEEFKIIRRCGTSSSATVEWSDEGAAYITSDTTGPQTYVYVYSAMNLSVNTVIQFKGEYIRIDSITEGATYDQVNFPSTVAVTASNGDYFPAFFAPSRYATQYEIGNTEVYLQFVRDADKIVFKEGDRIEINCPGYKLVADEASKQIALNTASMNKHRKRQYPQLRNRFFTRKLAKLFAAKLRTENAFPKYRFEVEMTLSNYMKIQRSSVDGWSLSNVNVRSKKLLPYRPGYQESCRIASIEHSPQQGKTKLVLLADNFY